MKNIIQKIKDLFKPVELNFVEYLCYKRHLDNDYHAKIRALVRYIHEKGAMSLTDYYVFVQMGISFGEGKPDKTFYSPYPYEKVIYQLIEMTDNKYNQQDIEKCCGIGLDSRLLEKFEFTINNRK